MSGGTVTIGDMIAVLRARDELSPVVKAAAQVSTAELGKMLAAVLAANNEVKALKQQWLGLQNAPKAAALLEPALGEATVKAQLLNAELGAMKAKIADSFKPPSPEVTKSLKDIGFAVVEVDDKMKAAAASAGGMGDMVERVTERLLIYASVRGVISAIEDTLSFADEVKRLGDQLGMSTDRIQQFQFASSQTGVPVQTITQAITQMQKKIALEDGGLIKALDDLGLKYKDIRGLSMEESFDVIAEAMSKVTDQERFAGDAALIFNSRSGASIASVIRDWQNLKKQAQDTNVVMDRETLDALDAAGDAWDALKMKAKSYFGSVLAWAFDPQLRDALGRPLKNGDDITTVTQIGNQQASALAQVMQGPKGFGAVPSMLPDLSGDSKQSQVALAALRREAQDLDSEVEHSIQVNKEHQRQLEQFNRSVQDVIIAERGYAGILAEVDGGTLASIRYDLEHKASVEDIARTYAVLPQVVKGVAKEMSDEDDIIKRVSDSHNENAQEIDKVVASINKGGGLHVTLNNLSQAMGNNILASHDLGQKVEYAGESMEKLKLSGKSLNDQVLTPMPDLSANAAKHMKELGDYTKEFHKDLGDLGTAFSQLAQVSDGSFKGVVQDIAEVIGAMKVVDTSIADFEKSAGSGNFMGQMTSMVGMAAGFMSSTSGGGLKGILGGAMTGAQIGEEFGGAIGAGIGAAAGAITGALRSLFGGRTTVQQVAEDGGKQFGMTFSENLAKSIADHVKDFGGSNYAAMLGSLKDIIAEAGGLNSGNLDTFMGKTHDIFSMIDQGHMSVTQASKALDDVFPELATAATDSYGRISQSLKDLITLNAQYGTESKQIADFLQGQGSAALDGFSAVVAGVTKPISDLQKSIDGLVGSSGKGPADLLKQYQDQAATLLDIYNRTGHLDASQQAQYDAANAKIYDLQHALDGLKQQGAAGKQTLGDLGIQAVASFTAAVAAGKSEADALKQISPALTSLQAAYKTLGLDVDDVALKTLLMRNSIMTANPELMGAISGLTQEMTALDNMGLLSVQTFESMERTGAAMYKQLQDQVKQLGGSDKDALSQMQTFLHNAQKEAEALGVPLDENTQSLIDQSKQLGIWQEAGTSATDKLLDGMTKLVDKVGALVDRLNGVSTAITNMPSSKEIDIYTKTFTVDGGGNPSPYAGFDPTQYGYQFGGYQASGGDYLVDRPTVFVAGDAGRERVTFTPGGGAGNAATNDDLLDELQGLREDLKTSLPAIATSAAKSALAYAS